MEITCNITKNRYVAYNTFFAVQVEVALKHFRDVISKNKLEMLAGNGTIVVEAVQRVLWASGAGSGTTGAALGRASGRACEQLTRLVRLCDDVLVNGERSGELAGDNVREAVEQLEEAVIELVALARERRSGAAAALPAAQRNSLPDIALGTRGSPATPPPATPPPTVVRLPRTSHSTESVLRDVGPPSPTPPPKPPLPHK